MHALPPNPNTTPADAVIVRWMALDGIEAAGWERLATLLDSSEHARAARFHFDRDRHAYVAAHALTRATLSRATLSGHAAAAPQAWRFVAGPHGKPEINGPPCGPGEGLRFNLSHTHGVVAVAVTHGYDVGVDVERVDPRRLGSDITDRFFAPAETDHLRTLPPFERTETAYAFWTLKEAYIKATGLGLACPLDAFHFELDPLAIRFSDRIVDDPRRWMLHRARPTAEHAMALAVRHPQPARLRIDGRAIHPAELTR